MYVHIMYVFVKDYDANQKKTVQMEIIKKLISQFTYLFIYSIFWDQLKHIQVRNSNTFQAIFC